MRRSWTLLFPFILLTLLLTSCGLFRKEEHPEVDLTGIFPDELPAIGRAVRLDVDGVGDKEWLVFYHIDLVEGYPSGSPTTAAVYRPVPVRDKRLPPHLVPALLWLPNQGYLCLYACEAKMEDVISGEPNGKELVIRDKRGSDTVGVAIFRWNPDLVVESNPDSGSGGFVPLGHFRADSIVVEKDRVTVIHRHHDRSDLASREIYAPAFGRYYVQEVRHVDDPPAQLGSPQEADIVFALGPPKKPAEVKQPEKLVLAFYQNFRNLAEVSTYFRREDWLRVNGLCQDTVCGCVSRRDDLSRVLVKQIAYETALSKTTNVVVQVVCIKQNNQPDPMTTLTWSLNKEPDNTWRLYDVVPGGEGYLCPRSGCPVVGAGE